jgi:bifunctional N-acetylglucosamine-1-phosphate-uridyltransferase/glucosamine-1-phosphate-acetyltransferase GlmU-like protein
MLVNGRPLIQHAIRHALDWWHVNGVTVVASPDNVKPICDVCDNGFRYVIQPKPFGVIDAIDRGLFNSQHTLILCADNTFSPNEIVPPVLEAHSAFIASRQLEDRQRFTRLIVDDYGAVLKVIDTNDPEPGDSCWIGPLLLPTNHLRTALYTRGIRSVAQLIEAAHPGGPLVALPMHCEDFGIPEAL